LPSAAIGVVAGGDEGAFPTAPAQLCVEKAGFCQDGDELIVRAVHVADGDDASVGLGEAARLGKGDRNRKRRDEKGTAADAHRLAPQFT
jgi:hypothetical protein